MNADEISIPVDHLTLQGFLARPGQYEALVIFAHGSGSSRFSLRNQHVAQVLNEHGLGTLLCDLLSHEEQVRDDQDASLRFDIPLLARRLTAIVDWVCENPVTRGDRMGLFGASTGAAAALIAAHERPNAVSCVVSRGGRPDLAKDVLEEVICPTLLIVGGNDRDVLDLNEAAAAHLKVEHRVTVIPGATHLFEEPGTLDQVARLAGAWFKRYLILHAH